MPAYSAPSRVGLRSGIRRCCLARRWLSYFEKCAGKIADARLKMTELLKEGETLASQNIGIPFFDGI
jgi:hypothetical protein